MTPAEVPGMIDGQPEMCEHTIINDSRDVSAAKHPKRFLIPVAREDLCEQFAYKTRL